MGNSKASSVSPLPSVEPSSLIDSGIEQARDFHFAVTWVTLFAHLDPIESTGPRPREEASPTLALVPVVVSPPLAERRATPDANAAWEMVVPKMIRTGQRTFIPAEEERTRRTQELL
jgi:hypothetical protein